MALCELSTLRAELERIANGLITFNLIRVIL